MNEQRKPVQGAIVPTKPKRPKDPPPVAFKRLVNPRLQAALKRIALVGNLANKSSYAWTPEQAASVVKQLMDAVESVTNRFHGNKTDGYVPIV